MTICEFGEKQGSRYERINAYADAFKKLMMAGKERKDASHEK